MLNFLPKSQETDFEELLDRDTSVFKPYLNYVINFTKTDLKKLKSLSKSYYRIFEHANNNTVDKLSKKLTNKFDEELCLMLTHINSDYGLSQLNKLTQTNIKTKNFVLEHNFILEDNLLHRRFILNKTYVVEKDIDQIQIKNNDALQGLLPQEYLPQRTGLYCKSEMGHILSLNLGVLDEDIITKSPLKYHHWFMPSGEECCDESTFGEINYIYKVLPGSDIKVEIIGDYFKTKRIVCESNHIYAPALKNITLVKQEDVGTGYLSYIGTIGGLPDWWFEDETPTCPECQRTMFFVGQLKCSFSNGEHYGFHCEKCGIGVQIHQDEDSHR